MYICIEQKTYKMIPTIITLANQKGGVGKSVLASIISTEFFAKHKSVCLLDCDEQGTIEKKRSWQIETEEKLPKSSYDIYRIKTLAEYHTFMKNKANLYKYIIVDTKGELSEKTETIISYSNFVILPIQESDCELMSFELYLIDSIDKLRKKHKFSVIPILNCFDKRSANWRDFYEIIPTIMKDHNIDFPLMNKPNTLGYGKQLLQLGNRYSYRILDTLHPVNKRKGIPKIVKQEVNNFIKSLETIIIK